MVFWGLPCSGDVETHIKVNFLQTLSAHLSSLILWAKPSPHADSMADKGAEQVD